MRELLRINTCEYPGGKNAESILDLIAMNWPNHPNMASLSLDELVGMMRDGVLNLYKTLNNNDPRYAIIIIYDDAPIHRTKVRFAFNYEDFRSICKDRYSQVAEIYDMSLPLNEQLESTRAFNPPVPLSETSETENKRDSGRKDLRLRRVKPRDSLLRRSTPRRSTLRSSKRKRLPTNRYKPYNYRRDQK